MAGIRVLFSAEEIAARVDALADEIARTLPDDLVVVGLLKGAAVFVADLVRALDRARARPEIEFIRLSSYGTAKESSRQVQLLDLVRAGRGKHRRAGRLYRPTQDHVGDRLSASGRLLPGSAADDPGPARAVVP